VAAAAGDLVGYTPSSIDTVVVAGVGASPCDLWDGFREPRIFGGKSLAFRAAVDVDRPKVVVLAFTGNPGISKNACITQPNTSYSLSDIVSRYRQSLSSMGTFATRMGARVILSATPARNPNVPEGWVDHSQHGYNGDQAFNVMMFQLGVAKHWTFDTQAVAAISGAGLGWTLYLPCRTAVDADCVNGRQQVRYGGPDAIHCDAPGTNGIGAPSEGSLRFAHGLLEAPLEALGRTPLRDVRSPSPANSGQRCAS
jgi:hypothetical protein